MDRRPVLTEAHIGDSPRSILIWAIACLALIGLISVILLLDKALYIQLAKESANTELLTAVYYLVAGLVFLYLGIRRFRNTGSLKSAIFRLLFGLIFVFVAMEEESWGQWIFGFETPASIRDVNYQQETNIHNLNFFQDYSTVFSPHRIQTLFVVTTGILLPLLAIRWGGLKRTLARVHFPLVPLSCVSWFLFAIVFEKVSMVYFDHWANIEIREFLISIGILLFALSHLPAKASAKA